MLAIGKDDPDCDGGTEEGKDANEDDKPMSTPEGRGANRLQVGWDQVGGGRVRV
jgi:hypothetical protein